MAHSRPHQSHPDKEHVFGGIGFLNVPHRIPTVSSIYHNANNADGSARYADPPPSHPLSLGHLEDPIVIPNRTFEQQIALDVHLDAYTTGGQTRATSAIAYLGSR